MKLKIDNNLENINFDIYEGDELVGSVENTIAYYDIKCQIKLYGLENVTARKNGEVVEFNKYGQALNHEKWISDGQDEALDYLIGIGGYKNN